MERGEKVKTNGVNQVKVLQIVMEVKVNGPLSGPK